MKGIMLLLQKIFSIINDFFQTEKNNTAGSFVSRYKDSYNQKLNFMNITPETSGYFMPGRKETLSKAPPAMAAYSSIYLITYKKVAMKKMLLKSAMLALVLLLANLFFIQKSFAQGTMGRWQMCGLTGTTSGTVAATGVVNANVTFSALSRGAGLTASSATDGYSSSGFSTSTSLTISNNDYYEFTITPAAGYKISITAIKVRDQVSTTASSFDAYLRYSDDSYGSNVVASWTPSTTISNRTLNTSGVSSLQNRVTPVTFRIYGTDADQSSTTYRISCEGTNAGQFRGVDIDGTVAQLAYASQLVGINTGGATWCAGETRNVTVQIKNIGSAAWADASGNDFNVGVKWNTNGTSWTDYHVRVDAQNLASGATGTYVLPITASNATIGPVYGTVLAAGTNNLTFDIVYEGVSWFGTNGGIVGPGNTAFVSANQTITALPTITKGANPTVCQGSTSANLTYSATTNSPTQYSIDYDAAANLAGFVDVVNAALPATPIVMVVPGAVAGGVTYNGTLTVRNTTTGCSSVGQAIAVTVTARPVITPGTNPVVCRGTTSALLSYTATGTPNQYSIDYDATANAAGFVDITNASLPGSNITIAIPGGAAADVYNATLTVRNTTTGCVSVNNAITVTVNAPSVSFAGPTTLCIGGTTNLFPTSGGTWISNSPLVASVNNAGDVTALTASTATFTFTETATGCSSTTGAITVNADATLSLTSAGSTTAQTRCINNAINNITYLVGGSGTGATVTGLPAGVTFAYNSGTKVLLISGTPTVAGSFSYTVTTSGPCVNPSLGGTIEVTAASGISLTSGTGSNIQTRCINNAITNITYAMSGTGTSISITAGALPAGVTGSFDGIGTFTIAGAPTVAGTFNYTVTTAGPCPLSLTGTITVTGNSTLALTSAGATTAQTTCISTAITNITYLVGGTGTGATVSGLPTGVTSSYNSGTKVLLISGTPSVAGTFNYTVNTAGPCVNPSLGGTITVTPNATISLSSAVATTSQVICANIAITGITYAIGGSGTGANVSGLPAGLTTSFNAGVYTISGTASVASGTFNYTITTTGPCVNPSLTGTIVINPLPVVTIAAVPATICIGGTSTLTATNSGGSVNQVFSGSNATTTAIPDFNASAYTYSTISLAAGAATLSATDLLQVTLNITHGEDQELDIYLVDPSGTKAILLTSDNGGNGNNYTNTVLRTDAANVIGSTGNTTAPFTGTYRPEGTIATAPDRAGAVFGGNYNSVVPAAALTGAGINGAWSLRIFDDGFSGSGSLTSWSLSITKPGAYSTVFSGAGSFASVLPGGGATNTTPSVVVTPPAGLNSYTATTTDAVGCQSTTVVPANVTVNSNSTISLTSSVATTSQVVCTSNAITDITYEVGGGATGAGITAGALPAGVTAAYNAGVFTISGTPTASGVFSYTVTTTGPCTNVSLSGSITVNANSTITRSSAAGTDAQTKCISTAITNITYAIGGGGTGATLTGTLPTGVTGTYSAGVFTISGAATQTGTFNYTVTTTGPCVNNALSGSIVINPNATINLTSAPSTTAQVVCNNFAITPVTYAIGAGGTGAGVTGLPAGITGLFNAGVFTISGSTTVAGTYNYTVTTTGTCIQATANGSIVVSAPITATFTTTNVSACGGSADATINVTPTTGTAPYIYSWTGMTGVGAHVPFTAGNVSTLSGLDIGYYDVTFTDANGCSGTITGIHIQYAFSAYVTNNGSISSGCANTGSIILYANAGIQPYTFSLDGITYQSNNTFLNLAAGTYTAYVKDGGGCVATKSIFVAAAPPVVVNPYVRPASSCSNDGAIEIYRTGGIPPYQYSLDGITYQSGNVYSNLSAGPYTAYVKDSKGCIGVTPVTVTQGASLGVTVSKTLVSTCQNDGSMQATPTGGTAPYTYSLNDVTYQASNSFGGLAAGNYTVWVKDSKGCKGFRNVTLNLNLIGVTYNVTAAGSCVSTNGAIQLFRTGGVGPYTYSIDGNTYQSSSLFTNLAPGTYDGFVKDSKTCIGATFNIVVGPEGCEPLITGNLKGAKTEPRSAVKVSANSVLKVSAYPNPSTASFKLILDGGNNEKVVITVSDLAGRTIYQSEGSMNKQYNFGSNFIPGMYILKVIQGTDKQTIKLVKE